MAAQEIPIGSTVDKAPEAETVYAINWAPFIGANTLTSNTWTVEGPDSALLIDNNLNTTLVAQARVKAGTIGAVYRVYCEVGISGSPTQKEKRSFYVRVVKR